MKDVPKDQQEMLMTLMEKNPDLMEKIAKEIQVEMKAGKNQMSAAMTVLPRHQKELQEAMGKDMVQKLAEKQAGARGTFNPNGSIRK